MNTSPPDQYSIVELEKRRRVARQRFIGALALVVLAVMGLPWLLDTKPRPLSPDVIVEIQSPPATTTSTAPAALAETPAKLVNPVNSADSANTTNPTNPTNLTNATQAPTAAPTDAPIALATTKSETTKKETAPVTAKSETTKKETAPVTAKSETVKTETTKTETTKTEASGSAIAAGAATQPAYYLQAGAFNEKAKASALVNKLKNADLTSTVQEAVTSSGVTRYRVRLGPYASVVQTQSVSAQLSKLGVKSIIIKP